MEKMIKPAFQTRDYHAGEVIAIRDRYQQYLYTKNSFYPIDMYVANDNLVMIYPKNELGKELYEKYRKYELK